MWTLVTGATGFIGDHLARRLIADGEPVRLLVRSAETAAPLAEQGAELVVGEITNCQVLCAALQGVEVVYHLAGRLSASDVPVAEYYRMHVEGVRALLDCCREQPSLRRVVHISTTGVLGVTGDRPADETAPPAPTNVYEQTKWKAELLVGKALQQGLPAVIVRAGLVYGPGDLHLLGFFRAVQRGLFRPIGSQPVWIHPIYVDDLIEALVRCAQNLRAAGERFHIACQKPVTIATLSATIATALGKLPPCGTIPLPVARSVAAIGELLPTRLKVLAPLTRSRLDFLTHTRVYDVTKAQQLLGFVGATDLPVGIARTAAWYRQQDYLPAP